MRERLRLRLPLPSADAPREERYSLTDPDAVRVARHRLAWPGCAPPLEPGEETVTVSRRDLAAVLSAATDYDWLAVGGTTREAQRKLANLRRAVKRKEGSDA